VSSIPRRAPRAVCVLWFRAFRPVREVT
jgi:hypothetical protein